MNFNITAGMLVETPNGVATALHYLEGGLYVRHPKGAHINQDLALKMFGNGNGLGQAAVYPLDKCYPANGLGI